MSENIVDKLTRLWQLCDTRDLASFFESYMLGIGVRKYDARRKSNTNTYLIDAKSTNWNRVQCYFHKESDTYSEENLLLVLRKRAGDYFIIAREGIRAFEVDSSGLRHHDEVLLNEIMQDHRPLFDKLFLALGVN